MPVLMTSMNCWCVRRCQYHFQNLQSSSLIRMKAVLGSPFMTFHVFAISGPKLNSAIKISSNSSTSSSTMVKFSNADLLAGVKVKSLNVFTTSVRPDSAIKMQTRQVNFGMINSCIHCTTSYVSLEHCQKQLVQISLKWLARWKHQKRTLRCILYSSMQYHYSTNNEHAVSI